jgi:hypothetical protein
MPDKHYVYSARTTREGLELLNKARGERGWDAFINEAVCGHYNLDPTTVIPPPSRFLADREERRKAREAGMAKKAEGKKAEKGPRKAAKKAAKGAAGPQPA